MLRWKWGGMHVQCAWEGGGRRILHQCSGAIECAPLSAGGRRVIVVWFRLPFIKVNTTPHVGWPTAPRAPPALARVERRIHSPGREEADGPVHSPPRGGGRNEHSQTEHAAAFISNRTAHCAAHADIMRCTTVTYIYIIIDL